MKSRTQHARLELRWPLTLLGILCILVLWALTFVPSAQASGVKSFEARDNCAISAGTIAWSLRYIEINASISQGKKCSGSSFLYLSWNSPNHHNVSIVGTTQGHTDRVHHTYKTWLSPGHITLTVCSTHGGWHCGKSVRV